MRVSRALQCRPAGRRRWRRRTQGRSLNETELMTGRENANRTWRIRRARMGKGADGRRAGDRRLEYGRLGRARGPARPCRLVAGRSLSIGGGQRSVGRAGLTTLAVGMNGQRAGLTTSTRTHIELPRAASVAVALLESAGDDDDTLRKIHLPVPFGSA